MGISTYSSWGRLGLRRTSPTVSPDLPARLSTLRRTAADSCSDGSRRESSRSWASSASRSCLMRPRLATSSWALLTCCWRSSRSRCSRSAWSRSPLTPGNAPTPDQPKYPTRTIRSPTRRIFWRSARSIPPLPSELDRRRELEGHDAGLLDPLRLRHGEVHVGEHRRLPEVVHEVGDLVVVERHAPDHHRVPRQLRHLAGGRLGGRRRRLLVHLGAL